MNQERPKFTEQPRPSLAATIVTLLGIAAASVGCASLEQDEGGYDPWQKDNREMYQINTTIDNAVFKPVAEYYIKVTPVPVRTSVSNFFDNIDYGEVIINDFLQGKFKQGVQDTGRFVVNTVFGGLGLFDVATDLGLEAHNEDLGQTLAVWGAGAGPYWMLPLLGPSTVRDAPGLALNAVSDISFYFSAAVSAPLGVLKAIDARARAVGAFNFINQAALDPYVFTREAYLQNRQYLIYDGNPPPPKFLDDAEYDTPYDVSEPEPESSTTDSSKSTEG